jgi:tungstate transport system substrate-binding protein
MIMVHASDTEKKAVIDGWATNRLLIGSNEFFIVGSHMGPASISKAKSAIEAYAAIGKAKATFFSRGDNFGSIKRKWMSEKRLESLHQETRMSL